ncbi:MAG TPA: ATP-binding protein [Patescibacteria group bacterium]|nr:ATP-binding protein [Patescibacteria group bacterium]
MEVSRALRLAKVLGGAAAMEKIFEKATKGIIRCSCRWVLLPVVLLFLLICAGAGANGQPAHILVLHSYSYDYRWTASIQRGIENILQADGRPVELHVEYMDTNRIYDPEYLQRLQELYRYKFQGRRYDVIICTDNNAFDFARYWREELFPATPVVFCGINGYSDGMMSGGKAFTGVAENADIEEEMKLVLRLHPQTKNIVIYGDEDSLVYQGMKNLFQQTFAANAYPVRLLLREGLNSKQVLADLKSLPADSVLFAASYLRDEQGSWLPYEASTELISQASPYPVYGIGDATLGYGIVGGYLVSAEGQGEAATGMALRILNGEIADDIPVMEKSPNRFMFDYRQLERFRINRNDLPAGSTIINLPESFYETYKLLVWGVCSAGLLLLGIIAVLIVNINRRRRVERALRESERRFRAVFAQTFQFIGLMTLAGTLVKANRTALTESGVGEETVIGKPFWETPWWSHSPELQLRLQEGIRQAAAGEFVRFEAQHPGLDGEMRWIDFSLKPVRDEKGDIVLLVPEGRDITEIKATEQALQRARDELERKVEYRTQELLAANEELSAINQEMHLTLENLRQTQNQLVQAEKMAALGQLVAGVAHEINTPVGVGVTAVTHLDHLTQQMQRVFSEGALTRRELAEYLNEGQETLRIITTNLSQAARLIVSFKQISVDQSCEARRIFRVKEYLEEILLSLQPKLKKNRHQVMIDCSDELEIDGYPGALGQVVTNLIVNSLMHAYDPGDTGRIRIQAKREAGRFHLRYMDDGRGMDESVRSQIFTPFFTTKRGSGGTGLGLHILYNIIVQQFGGTVECRSNPGQGTAFDISFPLK